MGSGTHAEQTAAVVVAFERYLTDRPADAVVVVGDVNSTVACAMAAAKLHTPVAHVEAGLRSRDWEMPEEINRVLTDRISRWLFTTSADADANLAAEGVPSEWVHLVGIVLPSTVRLVDPLGYHEFVGLVDGASVARTDSGGVQEETSVLGVPCVTLGEKPERPITCDQRDQPPGERRSGRRPCGRHRGVGLATHASQHPVVGWPRRRADRTHPGQGSDPSVTRAGWRGDRPSGPSPRRGAVESAACEQASVQRRARRQQQQSDRNEPAQVQPGLG